MLCGALLAAEAVWGVLALAGPATKQMRVFCCQGQSWFMDYKAPRDWAVDARHYHPENVGRWDVSCYPPICYDLVKGFPADRVKGGLAMAAVSFFLMALAVFHLAWRNAGCGSAGGGASVRWLAPAALTLVVLLSAPSLFCFSTGNSLPIAVAGVSLFFAWKDERGWRRAAALLALAAASALKFAPAFFALVLLCERRWRDFAAVALVAATLVFVPFAWYGGGAAFCDFLKCLRLRGDYYGIRDSWGFVGLDRCLRLGLGRAVETVRSTYPVSRSLNVVCALACLALGLRRLFAVGARPDVRLRGLLLLSVALVMLPGGSVFYNALFLVPALVMGLTASPRPFGRRLTPVAWFLLLCPLQVPFSFSSVNVPLAALAMVLLGLSEMQGDLP